VLVKYERIEPLGTWFGKRLDEVVRAEGKRLEADIVVPVPLHRQREKERGYNQVDLFGRSLARRLGLAYRPVLLKAPSRGRRSICSARRSAGKRYVALLLWKTVVELTIPESCC
jgi:predicted amidophosphoribosyltransferase